ncbi:hypothetical protein Goe21_01010 [Bacillus phage vB_BsuM-Goe21]|nr:hypothetical protein Goe21_01010 [Bacillus phage vB_BsuM-Goe21]
MKVVKSIVNVAIQPESVDYMNNLFSCYTEENNVPHRLTINNPVIHMYPKEDTYGEDGKLYGFIDVLRFTVDIYDSEKKIVYRDNRLRDVIKTNDSKIKNISYFKDLSTMISFDGKHMLLPNYIELLVEKI